MNNIKVNNIYYEGFDQFKWFIDNNFCEEHIGDYNKMFLDMTMNHIKPANNIEKVINDFCEKNNIDKSVGLHIRRNDFNQITGKLGICQENDIYFHRVINNELRNDSDIKFSRSEIIL